MDVSIIIPTYNRLWSLPKAIESCRRSRCKTEIIVVDDGSTDGTREWLQDQSDLILLYQENWGKGWAVNRAFALAKGQYVRFLDSDDWLLPGANEGQWEVAVAAQADVMVSGYEFYSEDEKLLRRVPWTPCDDFIAQQLGESDSSHYSAYLFRKEFIREIPHRPDFSYLDDRLFVLEVALAHPKVAMYWEPTLAHRHHSRNRLQCTPGMKAVVRNFQHLTIYQKCLAQLAGRQELTLRRKKAACKILWPLAHWIAYTHPKDAAEVVAWIQELDPDFQAPEPGWLGRFYRSLGFEKTEWILRLRRKLLALLR